MRVFAALPLFAVLLVSLCGSPVPPPPSDVSGIVFFDANRNGIHDACDSALVAAHLVLHGESAAPAATSGGLGKFTFERVPAGDYVLGFAEEPGRFWPLTTVTDGANGIAVSVKTADVADIELGAATTLPLETGPRVIGLAYDDADGDGAVSEDECGISFVSTALTPPAERAPRIDTPGSFEVTTTGDGFGPIIVLPPPSNDSWWVQTSPPPTEGRCVSPVAPQPRYADGVYELNVGFQLARGTASIHGVAFFDDNQDALRDPSERTLDTNIRLTVGCEGQYKPSIFASSVGEDGYEFRGLPAGAYVISREVVGGLGLGPLHAAVLAEWRLVVSESEAARADYPFRREPSGMLFVYSYFDSNVNGVFDDDPLVRTPPVCYRPAGTGQDHCVSSDQVSAGISLPPGTYEVYIPYTTGMSEEQTVEIVDGGAANAFFPGNP